MTNYKYITIGKNKFEYRGEVYNHEQLEEIIDGIKKDIDVSIYSNPSFDMVEDQNHILHNRYQILPGNHQLLYSSFGLLHLKVEHYHM